MVQLRQDLTPEEELRLWADRQMKWERSVASEHGKKIPRVRGIRRLNANVQAIMSMRDKSTHRIRALAAVGVIEEAVRRTYKEPA